MRTETFFIPIMGPSLNQLYAGVHWAKRKKMADKVHDVVASVVGKSEQFTKPVNIIATPIAGKRHVMRDTSNYAYTYKMIEDGLVRAGLLQDDSRRFVRDVTIKAAVEDRAGLSGMIIKIEEIPDSVI